MPDNHDLYDMLPLSQTSSSPRSRPRPSVQLRLRALSSPLPSASLSHTHTRSHALSVSQSRIDSHPFRTHHTKVAMSMVYMIHVHVCLWTRFVLPSHCSTHHHHHQVVEKCLDVPFLLLSASRTSAHSLSTLLCQGEADIA